jgi:ferredoxin-NADP reductase
VTHKHIDEMSIWDHRRNMLQCIGVTPESADVMTFHFRGEGDQWFRYLPGQFVTLELPVGAEPLYRTYTLSSTPSRPYSVAVTVKAQPDSIGTRWMFDNLKVGMKIRAVGPIGDFTYRHHPAKKYLFISAGSGITPMMSMLREMSDRAPEADVAFVNCARTPSDILFRHELEYLARYMPNVSLGFIVERNGRTDLWSGLKGFIDKAKVALLASDFMERTVFCCGPEPFMAAITSMLEASGFDMKNYHQESFAPALAAPMEDVPVVAEDDGSLKKVTFTLAGKEQSCQAGQTVLLTARAAGVRIGAACESGLCGTCRVLKISGEVEMNHNGGILDEEIDEGYILACCSRPLTDIEIEA